MSNLTGYRLTPRVVLGAAAIVTGVLLTLSNLGVPGIRDVLDYAPLLLVALGLTMALKPRGVPGRGCGILLTIFGAWWTLENLDFIEANIWDLWPLLLVFAGGYMVWQVGLSKKGAPGANDPGAFISAFAFLAGIVRRSTSSDFRGGDLTAVMGGVELDLRQASISSGEAVIDTFAWWGGVEIRVPETWQVVSKGLPLMGGFEDKTRSAGPGSKQVLVIRGLAIMGGVEVTN